MAVETRELSVVAVVLVRVELLLGQDVAAGLIRSSVVSSGGRTPHSISERGKDSAQLHTSQLKDTILTVTAWAVEGI